MGIVQQRTIKNAIHCRGVGLHSGIKTSLTLRPAAPDTGIVFQRIDPAGGGALIAADWRNVVESSLCTTLGNGEGISVGTVEHLMAALAGAEIDNIVVEIDGPEIPIMDGSAAPFLFLIECAGLAEQDAARRAIKLLKPVTVGDGTRSAGLLPDHGFSMSFEIDFPSKAVSRQDISLALDSESFKAELARARTFGWRAAARSTTLSSSAAMLFSTKAGCATPMNSFGTSCSTRSAISISLVARSSAISTGCDRATA